MSTCPEFEKEAEWFDETAVPRAIEFYQHVRNCEECRQRLFAGLADFINAFTEFVANKIK